MLFLHLHLDLPLPRCPSPGVHADVTSTDPVLLIQATCPAHCPLIHRTFSVISLTPNLDLIIVAGSDLVSIEVLFSQEQTTLGDYRT